MQAASWNRELFRETFSQVADATDLTHTDLAKIGGTSQATVSRWANGDVKPNYDPLRRFVDALIRLFPKLGDLPTRLLVAAGYAEGYAPPAGPGEEVEAVRQAAARIEDAARRERIESIVEQTLRDMEEDQQRRLRQLRDIIGLGEGDSD